MEFLKFFIFNFFFFFILYFVVTHFANQLKLIDYPNGKKTHKKPTPAVGGIIFLLLYISAFFQSHTFNEFDYFSNELVITSILIFFTGYYDDLRNHNPFLKSFFFVLIIFIFLFFNQEILIKKILVSFSDEAYVLNNFFTYTFTILCFWLLINSFNLADGYNGIASSLAIIFYTSLLILFDLNKVDYFFIINIIFFLILILIFNLSGKLFLGNNGSYLISFILGVYLIKFYNLKIVNEKIFADKIFLMLIFPGLDMLRLFIERLIKKKNPFVRDKNHLHHNLKKIVPEKYVFLLYSLLVMIPIFLDHVLNNITVHLILIFALIYFFLIFRLRKLS